ncbi:MAG: Abi family protein [Bacteroidia bacterium]
MAKIPFSKTFLSYSDQLNLLKDRGLIIDDEGKALHLLEHLSYYRLSGYWYPLLSDKEKHVFKSEAKFENAFKIYCFDRELRRLVLAEIEKIEVAVRSKITYTLSKTKGAFWFQDAAMFSNPIIHADTLSKIGQEFTRSDEEFIKAFKNKYSNPLPPSWITMEITSFGSLSMLYKNLKPGFEKRDISHHFGLADKVFETWLHSLVYLRNVCAHHTRLWNRAMRITPQMPLTPKKQFLKNVSIPKDRTYFILCMIIFFTANNKSGYYICNTIQRIISKVFQY